MKWRRTCYRVTFRNSAEHVGSSPRVSGETEERGNPPAVRDASRAIEVFERFWNNELLPTLAGQKKEMAATLRHKVPDKLGAAASTFGEIRREFEGSLTPAERGELILYGTPDSLPLDGACWRLASFGGIRGEIVAWVDPRTGKVVAVWMVPEG